MGINYSPPAEDAVRALMADQSRRHLSDSVLAALRLLDADPGDARCRRRSFAPIVDWGMPVRTREDDWLILWDWDSTTETAFVRYVGPEP